MSRSFAPITLVFVCMLTAGFSLLQAQAPVVQPAGAGEDRDDEPEKRAEWFFRQRAYPGNSVPDGYRSRAFEYMQARMNYRWEAAGSLKAEATGRWIELGPNNVGGRMLAIAVHPANPDIVWAGAADGGVFKTTNGGETWTALNDSLPSLAVKCLILDPLNPDIIYAGTGEGSFNIDAAIGKGVLKSTDGGATWTSREAFSPYVNRLAIHPTETGILYAATRNGVFKTTDAGAAWTPVFGGHNCIDIRLDPQNPQVVLTSVWDRNSGQTENGIWRTTDAGATWARVSSGLPEGRLIGRVALARSVSNPLILYAGVSQFATSAPLLGIFKSTDGGSNWSQLPGAPSYCGSQCWYDNELAVHPLNPDIVFAGGLYLWKSTNGGAGWARCDTGVHVDHHAIAFSSDGSILYNGNDGGMYRSADQGESWAALNYGLATTQFYSLAVSATDPTITYGGTQDNGTQKGSGPLSYQLALGGDGMVPIVDYTDPNFVYAESQNGGLMRSTNGGISFTGARTGISSSDRFNWVTPWTIDPVNPQVLYAGSHRLYKSTNRAVQWTPISDDLTKGAGTITAIAVAPSDPQTIYAGASDGRVTVTTDGGSSPAGFRTITNGLPNRYVTRLRVHPFEAKTVFATFSGLNASGSIPGHVFRSRDGGESWTDISSSLPDLPVQAIVIDPLDPTKLYIGTDLGCFRSLNDGASWEPFNDGLPNVVVDDMAFVGNTNFLRVATHGRGIWQYVSASRGPATIKPIVGNNQKAAAGGDLVFPVRVALFDAEGAPAPDAAVTFEIVAGGGAGGVFADGKTNADVKADQYGVANLPRLTLNNTAGSFTIRASAAGAAAANMAIETTTTAPQLLSASPSAAVASHVIIGGQNLSLTGSGFASPFFVYYIQDGTWYSTTSSTTLNGSTQIYSMVPSGLRPGKASIVVSRNGEFSKPLEIDVVKLPTAPEVSSILPSTPSPGQQFTAFMTGQQPGTERFALSQNGFRASGTNLLTGLSSALFNMPAFPFQPGNARLDIFNANSPSASSIQYSIPSVPLAPALTAPGSRAPEQLISISSSNSGFSTIPQYNVALFTQGDKTVESQGSTFSTQTLYVQVPGSLSAGPASLRVRSTFANGSATSAPVQFTIGNPSPAGSVSVSPSSAAPGARVTLSTTTTAAFNPNPLRNHVNLTAGGAIYSPPVETVSPLGNSLTFTLPSNIPIGFARVQLLSDFGAESYPRLDGGSLAILAAQQLIAAGGDEQVTEAGASFPAPLSVKVIGANGLPAANVSVAFAAPTGGASGFFEIGGNPTTTAVTGSNGIATTPVFKALNSGGRYFVRATVAGQPGAAVFALRNRNMAQGKNLALPGHSAPVSETTGAGASLTTGYVTAAAPGAKLAGVSIFSLRDPAGNLVSEAAVPDAAPSIGALLFVDARSEASTGVAIANAGAAEAAITLRLRDAAGKEARPPAGFSLAAGSQTARLLSEFYPDLPGDFVGTLALESSVAVAIVTLRFVNNSRSETIYSALPVASTTAPVVPSGEVSFAHLADGGGFRTSILLLNPSGTAMTGRLRFFDNKGAPLGLGSAGATAPYSIPPGGHFLFESPATPGGNVTTGYAVASADPGSGTPSGTLLFSYFVGNTLVAEAAVPGSRSVSHALLYIDTRSNRLRDSVETRDTGFAVANRGTSTASIRLIFRDPAGNVVGIPRTIELAAGAQMARFVDELLSPIVLDMQGSLEVISSAPVDILTLRGTYNARGEFLFTTLPVADYSAALQSALLFAHFADGAGYSTQTILLAPTDTSQTASVRYFVAAGGAARIDLR